MSRRAKTRVIEGVGINTITIGPRSVHRPSIYLSPFLFVGTILTSFSFTPLYTTYPIYFFQLRSFHFHFLPYQLFPEFTVGFKPKINKTSATTRWPSWSPFLVTKSVRKIFVLPPPIKLLHSKILFLRSILWYYCFVYCYYLILIYRYYLTSFFPILFNPSLSGIYTPTTCPSFAVTTYED